MEFLNDLGKPAVFEEDGYTVTRSCVWSAPGCHPTGCGVKLYVKDGVLCKIEGDENHPTTKGRLCVRCLTFKDFVYHKDRIIYPMKRARENRGLDRWERITWDEAYDIIKENVERIREDHGIESILTMNGTGRENSSGIRGHRVVGTPNGAHTLSGFSCYGPRVSITTYLLGAAYPEIDFAGGLPGGYDDPEYVVPQMIVQWGKEPVVSNSDGLFGHSVIDLMKRGAKLMTIDPRVTWTGAMADYHLQLRPGTDAALGMAMLDVIITENLYDEDFVDKWCYGFDELAERVHTMPAERAAEICGIPAEEIRAAARAYATSKPAAIAWGLAIDQTINGAQTGFCILALMCITGNMDVPGGQLLRDINDGAGDAVLAGLGWKLLPEEKQKLIIGLEEYPAYVGNMLQPHADRVLDCLETGMPYEIHSIWIGSTNFLSPTCSVQPKRWYNAMKDLDFIWATDVWMTPTIMALADIFLPIASFAEKNTVVPAHYGGTANYFSAVKKVIDVGETKGEYDNYFDLGNILNPTAWDGHTKSHLEFIEQTYLAGTGVSYDQLCEEVTHRRNVSYRKYETGRLRRDGAPGFNTGTGRIELYSYMFQSFGEDPLPYYNEPPYSPFSTPELAEKYPYVLTTGSRMYTYFHSEGRQIPLLREINPEPRFEINPIDAEKKGIKDGDWVRIDNMFGFCLQAAKVVPTIKPGVVHAQHGWWFPEENPEYPHFFGVWKANINSLIPHSRNGRLGFGAPYKAMICDFRKAVDQDFVDVDVEGIQLPGMPEIEHEDNFYRVEDHRVVGFRE